MSARESLAMFGTIAFDSVFMRDLIGFGAIVQDPGGAVRIEPLIDPCNLEFGLWFAVVPECYRADVATMIGDLTPQFLRLKTSPALLDQFVAALLSRIFRDLEPRSPA